MRKGEIFKKVSKNVFLKELEKVIKECREVTAPVIDGKMLMAELNTKQIALIKLDDTSMLEIVVK